ncbi:MAG TPA: hypothetical protein VM779_09285 [Thermoanaerobaculia bacterium]|nr:hypothetical protein [Thermoanaerobaculia bacterium]
MAVQILHAVVVLTLLPLLTLRGKWLARYFAVDVATYVVAAVAWRHLDGADPYFAAVAFVVAKIALFALFLNVATMVRWSPNRAFLLALLVYSLLVPAMQRTPIDGDEPFYLLVTESIVRDFDLDLSNQYRELDRSAVGRLDLRSQPGDPVGEEGEQYSRHEPLLSILLVPGYLLGGLSGALVTMVLFAALLVRSTMRFLEEEGIDDGTARAVFPFFAFGPPVVFYAARIWPEVPAAFFFVEALRGVRHRRPQRWIPALLMLSFLKLRFVLVALPLVLRTFLRFRRASTIAMLVAGLPLLVVWLITGSATNVHSIGDLFAPGAGGPFHGAFGLILDGAAGIAFQAPFYLLGIFALVRWREMPEGFRLGCFSAVLYLLFLVPRSEWHGGWSPPLRYIVFLMPVLALGAASLRAPLRNGIIALWTLGLVIHGVAYPWRLFHIANGENVAGEFLSRLYGSDFSRLFPSFIRLNDAAIVAAGVFLASVIGFAFLKGPSLPRPLVAATVSIVIAAAFVAGQQAGPRVDFEDAHVTHQGGELFPHEYTVARFAYRGGWVLHEGQSVSFLARRGPATLHYITGIPARVQIGPRVYDLPASRSYQTARVRIDSGGRVVLRVLRGSVNLDRLEYD